MKFEELIKYSMPSLKQPKNELEVFNRNKIQAQSLDRKNYYQTLRKQIFSLFTAAFFHFILKIRP